MSPTPYSIDALLSISLTRHRSVTHDINVLALVKGEERYIVLYDDERKSEALRTLGRFASNPELSFSWYDAAVLSQRLRQTSESEPESHPRPRFEMPTEANDQ